MKNFFGFLWKLVMILIGIPLGLFVGLILFLSITEFKPKKTENLEIFYKDKSKVEVQKNKLIRILSWNLGYAGLGAKQDFFMDKGSMVRPETAEDVVENMDGILATIKDLHADILLLQEIDRSSKRSYYMNQQEILAISENMSYASALNYKCEYVPYPIPTIGKVESGLASYSNYKMDEARRESLPGTFHWPVSLAHLKRCLLVTRFPLDSGKNLVLVNLHLEAFDDGPGREAQTKALMDVLKSEYEKGNYVIAGGDFNQTFPNKRPEFFALKEGLWHPGVLTEAMLPEGWSFASDDSAPTCRATHSVYTSALENDDIKKNWQHYLLDGFILSPGVELRKVKTMDNDFLFSDHNPVYIEVVLK